MNVDLLAIVSEAFHGPLLGSPARTPKVATEEVCGFGFGLMAFLLEFGHGTQIREESARRNAKTTVSAYQLHAKILKTKSTPFFFFVITKSSLYI